MTAGIPSIDRDKSPLLAADHDPVRIADALRRSPHIRSVAAAQPGDETVWFTDADGINYALSLTDVEPLPEGPQGEVYAWDAVAAALGNHPDFVSAALASEGFGPDNLDTITALTRAGNEYTLKLTVARRPDDRQEPPVPIDDILRAVGQLRARNANDPDSVVFEATADLLDHIVGTWDKQDVQTCQRAQALARALTL